MHQYLGNLDLAVGFIRVFLEERENFSPFTENGFGSHAAFVLIGHHGDGAVRFNDTTENGVFEILKGNTGRVVEEADGLLLKLEGLLVLVLIPGGGPSAPIELPGFTLPGPGGPEGGWGWQFRQSIPFCDGSTITVIHSPGWA